MKIQKESFYLCITLIVLCAGLLAYYFQPLTEEFISPIIINFLELNTSPQVFSDHLSPDLAFLGLFSIIFLLILRFSSSKEPFIYLIYGASLFFCFFYFFISPVESIVVLLAFFIPVFMWHQKKINNLGIVLVGIVLIATSWYLLQKPALFLLMMPMCHLFAIRANNSMQSRYSGKEVRVFSKLSTTQRSKISTKHSVLKQDLWEIISPELEALAESWSKVKEGDLGSDTSSTKEPERALKPVGILASLIQIQDNKTLANAVAAIKLRDKNFAPDQFLVKFKGIFAKVYQACYDQKIDTIQPMVSDALYEHFRCRIEEQKEAGIKFKCPGIRITGLNIARVCSDKNFDELHVMVKAEAEETAIDIVSGETLNAEYQSHRISEFWSFIRKPSAKTLEKPGLFEGNCPNCGAPISLGQATVCAICNSYIRSGNYDWVLSKITQACEWEYANPRLVPGWNDLTKTDKDFTIHQIEDRCAVIFWMLRLTERKRVMDPLLRFATPKCCEAFKFALKGVKNYTYMENVSFASATLKAISISEKCERIFVLVVWSGIPVKFSPAGRLPQVHRISKPKRDVFVFVRKIGQKTNQHNTLSSAHCSKCGGPLTSNFATNCSFCDALLNDGSEWILEKTISEESQEYSDIVNQKRQLMKKVVEETKKEQEDVEEIRSGKDLVSMAAQMLLADGKIDDSEMKMLRQFADKYEMPVNTLEGILDAVKKGELFIPKPEGRKETMTLLEAAISMALADGEFAEEEQKYLDALASKFGYSKTDLKMIMKRQERRIMEEKKAEEIRQRKLHNASHK